VYTFFGGPIYIYIYVYVCVCVCMCVRARVCMYVFLPRTSTGVYVFLFILNQTKAIPSKASVEQVQCNVCCVVSYTVVWQMFSGLSVLEYKISYEFHICKIVYDFLQSFLCIITFAVCISSPKFK
jgi:hypothetical protein